MTVISDWRQHVADALLSLQQSRSIGTDDVVQLIEAHCPFKPDTAYVEVPSAESPHILRTINSMFYVDPEGYLVKSSNGQRVPDNEPVVILRARDRLALPTLQHYKQLAEQDGCTDWFLERLDPPIRDFRQFSELHPDKMKQPGVTRGK